jgi:hypothetical protein
LKGENVQSRRHSDPLFHFSYSIFKIEFIVFKLAFLGFSLYGLYKFAEREIGFIPASSPPAEISKPVPSETSPAEQAKPQELNPKSYVSSPATSP